jgi:hypothetical protein
MPTSWSRNVASIAMQHKSSRPIVRGQSSAEPVRHTANGNALLQRKRYVARS